VLNILINSSLDGRHGCYLAYDQPSNVLYLVNDEGTALMPGAPLTGIFGSMSNSQCTVKWSNYPPLAAVHRDGNTLQLTFTIELAARADNQIVYVAARDRDGLNNTGWQAIGTVAR
jgi:hypothetical protein